MKYQLTHIKEAAVLSYLHMDTITDIKLQAMIQDGIQEILRIAQPRIIYKIYPYQNESFDDCPLPLEGKDIARLLTTSHAFIVMAGTLGCEVDRCLRIMQVQDMGRAYLYDQCANAAIEQMMDEVQDIIAQEKALQHEFLSDRFAPGYGDLPITLQEAIITLLDTQKQIGLHMTPSYLLQPSKSITGIIGISKQPQPAYLRGCAVCNLKDTCQKRKEGNVCVKE